MNEEVIHYILVRSRRKTFSLSVNGDGSVVVRAPNAAKKAETDAFVERHLGWIAARREVLSSAQLDLSDGAAAAVFGRSYTIATGRPRFAGGTVFLPTENRALAFAALLKRTARKQMAALTAEYALRFGFVYAGVRITSARGRWGSCNAKGAIAYSFRTAFLSEKQARYIVVHELCHTRHLDHSAAFWSEVGAILHDYAQTRRSLRKASVVMNWL